MEATETPTPIRSGADIRRLRRAAGLTQTQLAALAGLTISTIVNVEKEHRTPRQGTWNAILTALGIR